ncbi:MAG: IclR family transcriptional regulator [Nocardioidaceae bacterium]
MVDARSDGVSRSAATLIVLGSDEALQAGGLGVLRIAEMTGGDKGQVSRLLKTLGEHGLVERDQDSLVYRLGWQLFALAARAGDQRLLEVARPMLMQMVVDLGERANLSVLRGAEVLTVFSAPSPRAVQTTGWVGRTVPAYCTSSGRVLLLDHSKEDLVDLFSDVEFQRLGPRSPRDVDALYRRVVAARVRGYAVVDEEFEPGLAAAAAPVRDVSGRISGAVNISAPKFRLGGSRRLALLGRAVKDVADELSRRLGEEGRPDVRRGTAGGRR